MPPTKLYKYQSLAGDAFKYTQAIFARRQIYLAQVSQFNDPFEGKFLLRSSEPQDADQYQRVLSKLKNGIEKGLTALIGRRIDHRARLACLSECRDDVLMWSHYAASHTGICIEFDTTVPGSPFRECKKIEYSPQFHVINDSLEGIRERAVLEKAEQWKYEQEWRLIRELEQFAAFPGESLTGVILGCRISDDDRQWVLDWVKAYPRATVYVAEEVSYDFRLSIVPMHDAPSAAR